MIKVIGTDLDGTLFYPKKRFTMIPKKNIKFLERFSKDGGRIVLVSSRCDNFPPRIAKKLHVPFDFIGSNGSLMIIDGKVKERNFFNRDELLSIIHDIKTTCPPWIFMLNSKNYPLVLIRSGVKKIVSIIYTFYMWMQFSYREDAVRSDHIFFSEVDKGEVYKLMLFVGITKKQKLLAKKLAKEIAAKYPDVEVSWLNEVVEITPKGCTKASAVAKYLDYLGISHDNILVVGDGGNDVPMFQMFPAHSYAMEHAHPSVKAKASKTIRRFSDLEEELYPSADSKN